jgi:uncharacterized protein YndB with AHSA1/START domain
MQVEDRIEREIVIDAPIEHVWSLITESEHFGTWFADSGAEIDLRPGGAMSLSWEEHGTVRASVERVERPRLFSYRWANAREVDPVEGHSTLWSSCSPPRVPAPASEWSRAASQAWTPPTTIAGGRSKTTPRAGRLSCAT